MDLIQIFWTPILSLVWDFTDSGGAVSLIYSVVSGCNHVWVYGKHMLGDPYSSFILNLLRWQTWIVDEVRSLMS